MCYVKKLTSDRQYMHPIKPHSATWAVCEAMYACYVNRSTIYCIRCSATLTFDAHRFPYSPMYVCYVKRSAFYCIRCSATLTFDAPDSRTPQCMRAMSNVLLFIA
jgi:hypothetical protein